MNKIKYNGLDEYVIEETLSNGLRIYLVPNNKVNNFYMTLNTKYGSLITDFKKDDSNNYIHIPNGVAHFLEHLTFKMENGEDASDYFANLGSKSNAYTSFDVTCYEVYGYNLFKENLNTLLDYVYTPCYTDELVQNEKGIICEEVKMYEDSPENKLFFKLYENMLHVSNAKNLIAGSVDDVNSITLKDIENAYKTFYHPSNMFLVITGNFNPEETLAIIESNMANKSFSNKFKIDIKGKKEKNTLVKKVDTIKGNVSIDKVNIGFKIPMSNFKKLNLKDEELRIYISIILNSMFGNTSEVKDTLVRGNIITDGLYYDTLYVDNYVLINIIAETPYKDRYIHIIEDTIKNIKINEEDLNRKKKVAISNLIRSFDDIEEVNYNIAQDIINFDDIVLNRYEFYNNLDINMASKIANILSTDDIAILVLIDESNLNNN